MSQVQTQLKSGFASKVSYAAYSKNFLMAALVKKSKVHFDIFRYPLLDQHLPCSPLMRFSPASALSYVHFLHSLHLCDLLCSVPHCFSSRASGSPSFHALCSIVQRNPSQCPIRLSVHSTYTWPSPHLTSEVEPFPQGNPEPMCWPTMHWKGVLLQGGFTATAS